VRARRGLRAAAWAALAFLGLAAAPPAGAGEVALAFEDAPGGSASGFRIERRAAGAQRFEPLALVGPGVVTFVDRGAAAGKLLCYRVRPLGHAAADWSSEVCAAAVEPATHRPENEAAAASPAEAPAPGAQPAVSSGAPPERRVRAGGGWLQVLE
jgi:hypothetical protein